MVSSREALDEGHETCMFLSEWLHDLEPFLKKFPWTLASSSIKKSVFEFMILSAQDCVILFTISTVSTEYWACFSENVT